MKIWKTACGFLSYSSSCNGLLVNATGLDNTQIGLLTDMIYLHLLNLFSRFEVTTDAVGWIMIYNLTIKEVRL